MASELRKNDVEICVGYVGDPSNEIIYNVSSFVKDYKEIDSKWHGDLERFILQIDDKVKVDVENTKHRHVIEIVQNLSSKIHDELIKKDLLFVSSKMLSTGSLFAGLRVGRPYEADLLLVLDESVAVNEAQRDLSVPLFRKHDLCLKQCILEVLNWSNFKELSLHAVINHKAGFCLMLEYKHEEQEGKQEGLLIDIIPVVCLSDKISKDQLMQNAQRYISETNPTLNFSKYKLLWEFQSDLGAEYDTGYLEHQIVSILNNSTKCAYRVAKYLLQSHLALPIINGDMNFCNETNKQWVSSSYHAETARALYGYMPLVRSHVLQIFLIRLIMTIHGTDLEKHFTVPAITLCLLDMLYTVVHKRTQMESSYLMQQRISIFNPLLTETEENCEISHMRYKQNTVFDALLFLIEPALEELSCNLVHYARSQASERAYPLINSPNPMFDPILEYLIPQNTCKDPMLFLMKLSSLQLKNKIQEIIKKNQLAIYETTFTGFCRGVNLDEIAWLHSCEFHHFGKG